MPSYILRHIDRDLWTAVKAKLAPGGAASLKVLVESLLRDWLSEHTEQVGVSVRPAPDRRAEHTFVPAYGNRHYCARCGASRAEHRL